MPSTNPLTNFIAATIQRNAIETREKNKHMDIVHNILAVRLCDNWFHNRNGENIISWEDWSDASHHFVKKKHDKLSINSEKHDVVVETYARNAIKRRERFLAELEEEKKQQQASAAS
ncbi:hypothetical protein ACA910_013493 [Epithemia clementina (nom. ined.)]